MSIAKDCTMQYLNTVPDICVAVRDVCGSVPESVNLLEIRYCFLNNDILHIIAMVLLCMMAFYLLGNIADTFLTPVLTKVSDAMNLSESIAGVTLLAFANGAPDIIASITAADPATAGGGDGIYIGAGALFGACTFAGTCVLAHCIVKTPNNVEVS